MKISKCHGRGGGAAAAQLSELFKRLLVGIRKASSSSSCVTYFLPRKKIVHTSTPFLQQPKALSRKAPAYFLLLLLCYVMLCYLVVQILAFRPFSRCVGGAGASCFVAIQSNHCSVVFALF